MTKSQKAEIPNGAQHLGLVMTASMHVLGETAKHADLDKQYLRECIGTCLNALYQAATCHRKCHGGGHVLERLCARAYNLACGAYYLSVIGLYDESLNLIRGVGEIANLITLSVVDGPKIKEWFKADRNTRLTKFSPAKVRDMLKKKKMELCATDEWYREMCEAYTHITPDTQPNVHGGQACTGVKYDKEGQRKTLDELFYVSTFLAILICKYFKFHDLFVEITGKVNAAPKGIRYNALTVPQPSKALGPP
jgi:hypothetical protein